MLQNLGITRHPPRRGQCTAPPGLAVEVKVSPRTIRRLTLITAHLCSAMRHRSGASDDEGIEAVVDPSGGGCSTPQARLGLRSRREAIDMLGGVTSAEDVPEKPPAA
jgi:hypothetical protein